MSEGVGNACLRSQMMCAVILVAGLASDATVQGRHRAALADLRPEIFPSQMWHQCFQAVFEECIDLSNIAEALVRRLLAVAKRAFETAFVL